MAPSLPTPPAGSSAACRPQHLTFSHCPDEPHREPPLNTKAKGTGAQNSQATESWKAHLEKRGRWTDAQASSSPAVWVVGQERKRRTGPQIPSPPDAVAMKLLGSREGKAPGKLER